MRYHGRRNATRRSNFATGNRQKHTGRRYTAPHTLKQDGVLRRRTTPDTQPRRTSISHPHIWIDRDAANSSFARTQDSYLFDSADLPDAQYETPQEMGGDMEGFRENTEGDTPSYGRGWNQPRHGAYSYDSLPGASNSENIGDTKGRGPAAVPTSCTVTMTRLHSVHTSNPKISVTGVTIETQKPYHRTAHQVAQWTNATELVLRR